jgi:hypothetical protein
MSSTKKLIKKLIQKPLRFHHQDIHEEIKAIKKQLQVLQTLLIKLLAQQDNDTK